MNTLVNLKIKHLLFEKGWRYKLSKTYTEKGIYVNHSLAEERWNKGDISYIDNITISDVIMWLYETHKIFITLVRNKNQTFTALLYLPNDKEKLLFYNLSPTEAYEKAIEYTLNNLI